ncbi:hypothetical protein MATL_G00238190 [Megalops atlanticus]|uniref:Uncharacterized protein n=1 Tax=Megalops atlanticus TaxID=7932 RepID=A0A9D3PF32_MEGAT|nr:hypothetical protein MATL_G00238190 [Megalops atlanticus]
MCRTPSLQIQAWRTGRDSDTADDGCCPFVAIGNPTHDEGWGGLAARGTQRKGRSGRQRKPRDPSRFHTVPPRAGMGDPASETQGANASSFS